MQLGSVFSLLLVALSAVSATPALVSRTTDAEFESGLNSAALKILRKLNAKCYRRCIQNCSQFYDAAAGDDTLLQKCFNENCVPMQKDGQCLREQAKTAPMTPKKPKSGSKSTSSSSKHSRDS